jgi:hypothetical protein
MIQFILQSKHTIIKTSHLILYMEVTAACTVTHKTTEKHCVGSTPVLYSDVLNTDISWKTKHPDFIVVFLSPIK